MHEKLRQPANRWHLAGIALAVLVGVGLWLAQPVPANVKRDRQKLLQRAPFCSGRCEDRTPCLRTTRHPSRFCADHRPAPWSDPNIVVPKAPKVTL